MLLVYRGGGKLFGPDFDFVAYISKSTVEYILETAKIGMFTWMFSLSIYLGKGPFSFASIAVDYEYARIADGSMGSCAYVHRRDGLLGEIQFLTILRCHYLDGSHYVSDGSVANNPPLPPGESPPLPAEQCKESAR